MRRTVRTSRKTSSCADCSIDFVKTPKFDVEDRDMGFSPRQGYRIVAKEDIPIHGVVAGTYGGFVASPFNLPTGDVWIGDGVFVHDEARISFGARALGNVYLAEQAAIEGPDTLFMDGSLTGRAIARDGCFLNGTHLYDEAVVEGKKTRVENSIIRGNTCIRNGAVVKNS